MSSMKKNIVMQTAYQILNVCIPLITAPYLSRVLGVTNLGIFSYTGSIVSYFTMIAILGTINYGTRSIASVKNEQDSVNRVFVEIYSLQFIVSCLTLCAYLIYVRAFCTRYKLIALVQAIEILSCAANISWLFFGLEKFKITISCSIVVRLLMFGSIFVFVRTPNDLWKYTAIMLGGNLVNQLCFWVYVPRYVRWTRAKLHNIIAHFGPNLKLFLPLCAMSVYHMMDKTMLGAISTAEESGYYYNADKIVNIPVQIISGIGTVMLPRITSMIAEKKTKEANELFKVSLDGTLAVSVAMAIGIAAVAEEFVPIFFGPGYEPCILLCIIMAPILIIKGFSITAREQYLVPYKMEKYYTGSVVLGAVTNLVANFSLIPWLGAIGAAIGTLLAELAACIMLYFPVVRQVEMRDVFRHAAMYGLFALIMAFQVRVVANTVPLNPVVLVFLEIVTGGLVYCLLCLLLWKKTDSTFYHTVLDIIRTRMGRLNHKKR